MNKKGHKKDAKKKNVEVFKGRPLVFKCKKKIKKVVKIVEDKVDLDYKRYVGMLAIDQPDYQDSGKE